MKRIQVLALAVLAMAAMPQLSAKAEGPVCPVAGAECNLYWMGVSHGNTDYAERFIKWTSSLPTRSPVATFVDDSGDFSWPEKAMEVKADVGVWTGWFKAAEAGKYTFLCDRQCNLAWEKCGKYRYSIWVNEEKVLECTYRQRAFNAQLNEGFNSVKIIVWGLCPECDERSLSITYRKAGSLQEPMAFGPADMFHDNAE